MKRCMHGMYMYIPVCNSRLLYVCVLHVYAVLLLQYWRIGVTGGPK